MRMAALSTLAVATLTTLTLLPAAPAAAVTPLVDVGWVLENGRDHNVVVLDIRNKIDGGSQAAYRAGHIPGAVYSNYLTDGWRTTVEGVVGQMPPVADLERLIGGLGIGNDSHVVIVPGGVSSSDMGSATRIYFTFKALGHDRVSILDGGFKAYAADPANPLETGEILPRPATFKVEVRPELFATRDQVISAVDRGGAALLDHRPPAQFSGRQGHPKATRAGTIPGARNLPQSRLTEGGRFVSAERVAALLEIAGVDAAGAQISFCNSGHWASLGWFAASEILGNKKARLYDGSMVEWSARADLPEIAAEARLEFPNADGGRPGPHVVMVSTWRSRCQSAGPSLRSAVVYSDAPPTQAALSPSRSTAAPRR